VFRDGEHWLAFGDSITQRGLYHAYVELYYATRFPGRELTVSNAGIGGDRTTGAVRRVGWDVLAKKPTVVSVMFGMNDVDRFLYDEGKAGAEVEAARRQALEVYRANQRAVVARIQASGAKVILLTPTIFDDTAELAAPKQTGINRALEEYAAAVESLALETGAACVNFHRPMHALNQAQQAANPEFTVVGPDRIHPGPPGHLLMAYLFLKAQHSPALVSRLTFDAAGGRVLAVENGEAAGADAAPAGGLAFRWKAHALPFPVEAAAATVRAWVPFDAELNQEILRVVGLAPGRYAVKIDGSEVRVWTAEELDLGVNLALEPATPQYRQAQEVAQRVRQRFDLVAGVIRSLAMAEHLYGPRDDGPFTIERMEPLLARARESWQGKPPARSIQDAVERYTERKGKESGFEATARQLAGEARELARPREHRYEIIPATGR
jgi:lysophospholipase L1-like esterase